MIHVTEEFLRAVIQGKIEWRKCPNCQGEGEEYAYDDGQTPCTKQEWADIEAEYKDWAAEHPGVEKPDYFYGGGECCSNCEGLGYIEIP